ncbi:MAG: hypothetical protein U5K30_07410 [Acidimicrobiales bacterium]|nr:hypothetical protein [Acidimicrobiales bacterium]
MTSRRVVALLSVFALVVVACSSGDNAAPSDEEPSGEDVESGAGDGFVDEAWFAGRQDEYLEFATAELDPGSINNVTAHAERANRDPDFEWEAESVTVDGFEDELDDITSWKDTSDFDILYFVNLLYGYEGQLPAETVEAIDDALLGYEYWYTEPTPDDVIDEKYYWSENHRIIFHTIEYLVGQRHPDETFRNDGRTGEEHMAHAREKILTWLDEKADVGFSEWHSDVYYQKDVTPLLTLVEWVEDDDEITTQAGMVLDLVLFDIALHLHDGNLGVTHGRSYMKDKSKAQDQDVFGLAKLLFDDTDQEYTSRGDSGATLLARASEYRMPDVIRRVAQSDEPMVDRERMGVPLDPLAPVSDDPEAPYGYEFTTEYVDFWWERGAQPAWQVVPASLDTINTYELWDAPTFAPFQPLRDIVGDDVDAAQDLVQGLAGILSFALLNEANTTTYRDGEAMLSTVHDFRPGTYSDQHHIWQATLDEDAVVFTTHPKNEPFEGADSWPDADGYWTGSGSLPRSAQVGRTSLSLYAPRVPAEGALEGYDHLDFTHAWFPTERFDEVVRDGNWTFGRHGDGYVALYSWRAPEWRTHEPGEVFTDGLTEPFDLVAPGGPDNVWIAHVGSAGLDGSFEEFQEAVNSAELEVTTLEPTADGFPGGFDVRFASPADGEITLGQDASLTVDGEGIDLRHERRYDNPWASVDFQAEVYEISDDEGALVLDFGSGSRSVS